MKDWYPRGGYLSVEAYDWLKEYRVLPYAGGWLEQPAWLIDDFRKMALLREYTELNASLPKAPAQGEVIYGRK